MAGVFRDQNTFQLDGGNNTNDMDGTMNTYTGSYAGNGGVTGVMPTPVESIEEFKVNVTNQTADFNGSSGAQIQMVTRRGGNAWHGALYEYYLGSNFGANSWVNNHTPTRDSRGNILSPKTPLPSNHYNRFGASGGGPLGPTSAAGTIRRTNRGTACRRCRSCAARASPHLSTNRDPAPPSPPRIRQP